MVFGTGDGRSCFVTSSSCNLVLVSQAGNLPTLSPEASSAVPSSPGSTLLPKLPSNKGVPLLGILGQGPTRRRQKQDTEQKGYRSQSPHLNPRSNCTNAKYSHPFQTHEPINHLPHYFPPPSSQALSPTFTERILIMEHQASPIDHTVKPRDC